MTSKLSQDLYNTIFELGCMYHKDAGQCPSFPSVQYYRVQGDVWCQAGLTAHRAEGLRTRATKI